MGIVRVHWGARAERGPPRSPLIASLRWSYSGNKRLPNTILITFTRFSPLLHALSFKGPFAPRRGSAIELYVLIVLKLEVYVILSLADICLFAT